MNMKSVLGLAAGITLGLSASALATPITTPPPVINASGDVVAYYVFANAADTSQLGEVSPSPFPFIFCNHAPLCGSQNVAGDSMDLGVQAGPLVFSLDNLSTGTTFTSNAPDADGNYHIVVTNNYADFGLGALPAGVPSGPGVTYVAWEDLTAGQGSDFDYNDLIFAFTNTRSSIPEPLTLSLFGAGILGLVGLRRRRRTA